MIENGIVIMGYLLSYYTHEIDETNTVNGKPVYYQKDIVDVRVPNGAGQIILVNCTNLAIEDQNMNNASIGIQIAFSSSSTIKNNNCSNNLDGISLQESNNNCIANNNCLNNDGGIYFMYSNNNSISNNTCSSNRNGIYLFDSNNNCIYLNNFINNANNVDSSGLVNTWSSTREITYTYNETIYTQRYKQGWNWRYTLLHRGEGKGQLSTDDTHHKVGMMEERGKK
jgi:parallel beta-helix repeat protein